jgi:hypothetical protein
MIFPAMSDPLRYQILGDSELTAEERLDKYTGPVSADYLLPHLNAGVLLRVDPALDLRTAALAFIRDASPQVQAWLQSATLVRATHADLDRGPGEVYTAAVVSPFVLFQ